MKFWNSVFIGLCLICCSSISVATAETPSELLQNVIAEVSQAQSMEPAAKYLDWEGAYKALDPEEMKFQKITSPDALKAAQVRRYLGNADSLKSSIQRSVQVADETTQDRINWMATSFDELLAEQEQNLENDYNETSFVVGAEAINGDSATVNVTRLRAGASQEISLSFVRKGGQWKLLSAAALNPSSVVQAAGISLELLGPPRVSLDEIFIQP